jgi:hypothetical protein
MAEQTQLSDKKISDALGLKMGLGGANGEFKAPSAPKPEPIPSLAPAPSATPKVDYSSIQSPRQAVEARTKLIGEEQNIDRNILQMEQTQRERQAELNLENIEKDRVAAEERFRSFEQFNKDFPRPEFHPTKENMQDIATLFSLIGVVGMTLGGSGKMAAMNSLTSMTGMMKGWREGRSDLWKKELQEFEKSMVSWKAGLDNAVAELSRAEKLQAYNRQEADALAAVTVAKMGSPIISEKIKKQGISQGLITLKELQSAIEKEVETKLRMKREERQEKYQDAMLAFRRESLDKREAGKDEKKGRIKEKEATQIEGLDSLSDELRKLEKDFKPEYASLGLFGFGAEQSMEAKRRLGTEEGAKAVQWWSRYERLQAPNRHALFGATLTGNELINYKSFTAKKSDAPEVIRNMLLDQADYSQGTADQRRSALDKAGYKVPESKPRPFLESYGGAVKDFTSVEEAEKANLPSGTKITINGRSATVE